MNQIRLPARVATIELSNICNAKCRWCTMGIRNRTAMPEPRFMAPKLFAKGLDRLLEAVADVLREKKCYLERLYPYQDTAKVQLIRTRGELLTEEYREDGIHVTAYVPRELYGRL